MTTRHGLLMAANSLPQGVVDAAAGFGDALSFGGTALIREVMGINDVVDFYSGAYWVVRLRVLRFMLLDFIQVENSGWEPIGALPLGGIEQIILGANCLITIDGGS